MLVFVSFELEILLSVMWWMCLCFFNRVEVYPYLCQNSWRFLSFICVQLYSIPLNLLY